jgi:hypothetical protein
MKIKPWPIIVLALMNFFSPIGNVLLSAHLEKVTVALYLKELIHSHTYWDVIPLLIAPWLSAFAVFAVKEWSFYVFMSVVAFQTGNVIYQWYTLPQMLNLPTALALSALNAAFGYYFLLPEVRTIYKNKNLRWWEQKPRYEINLKCRIQTGKKSKLKAHIVDLSEGGVLLKLKPKEKLEKDENIELRFSRNDQMTLIRAKVVYARGDGGFGVQFVHTHQSHKFVMGIVNELKSSGKLARGTVSLSDDFNRWAKGLMSKGEGWRPALPTSRTFAPETEETKVADISPAASDGDSDTKKAA